MPCLWWVSFLTKSNNDATTLFMEEQEMEVLDFVDGIQHFKVKYLTLKEEKKTHKG